eukprot:6314617-Pyramimonas_sp.AAC.1
MAQGFHAESGGRLSSRACWKKAFDKVNDRRLRDHHPTNAIFTVLASSCLMAAVTSATFRQKMMS